MSAQFTLGAYRPGQSPLHRARPGAKLAALFLFAIATMITANPWFTLAWLAVGVALALMSGLRGRDFWRISRGFLFIAVPLFAFQTWQNGWVHAFTIVGDLLALILAASAITAATKTGDMVDTVAWLLTPLARFGVDPDRIALAFSLTISAIPAIVGIAAQTRDAARARGLERNLRALVVPLVIRSVAHAQSLGEALGARGVGDAAGAGSGTGNPRA